MLYVPLRAQIEPADGWALYWHFPNEMDEQWDMFGLQLQLLTSCCPSSNGGETLTMYRIAPQWQLALYVL